MSSELKKDIKTLLADLDALRSRFEDSSSDITIMLNDIETSDGDIEEQLEELSCAIDELSGELEMQIDTVKILTDRLEDFELED